MESSEQLLDWKAKGGTNLALFGSDLERKIKAAAAASGGKNGWSEGVGTSVALHVWRVEQFHIQPWPRRKYGQFHKGDSYIVLNTTTKTADPAEYDATETKGNDKLVHDIHIWIGSESTQDEYGTAAYKMVELDDKLGGTAVQHREVEGKESQLFCTYFDDKITYLRGGIQSGFTHVEPTVEDPHLFQIKGTHKDRSLRLTQIAVRRDCMNSGDVFVLVASDEAVWLWVGKEANPDEKQKGMEVARAFCPKGNVVILEEGVNDGEKQDVIFWKYLPGKVPILGPIKRSVHIKNANAKDNAGKEFLPCLFQWKGTGRFKLIQKAKVQQVGPSKQEQFKISRSKLQSTGVYLLDSGFHIFLWMGDKADSSLKAEAIPMAQKYIHRYRRPQLPVSILKERMENDAFQHLMTDEADGGCVACVIL